MGKAEVLTRDRKVFNIARCVEQAIDLGLRVRG